MEVNDETTNAALLILKEVVKLEDRLEDGETREPEELKMNGDPVEALTLLVDRDELG